MGCRLLGHAGESVGEGFLGDEILRWFEGRGVERDVRVPGLEGELGEESCRYRRVGLLAVSERDLASSADLSCPCQDGCSRRFGEGDRVRGGNVHGRRCFFGLGLVGVCQ